MSIEIADLLSDRDKKDEAKAARSEAGVKVEKPKRLTKKERQINELAEETVVPANYQCIQTEEDFMDMLTILNKREIIAVDTETMGVNPWVHEIVGFSIYAPDSGFYVPLKHVTDKCLDKDWVAGAIKPLFEDRSKKFLAHNGSFDSHVIYNNLGVDIRWYFDTCVAGWLLDETVSHKLKDMAPLYLGVEAETFSKLFGHVTFDRVPMNLATYYAIKDTDLTYKLYEFQMSHLLKEPLYPLFDMMFNLEMPIVQVCVEAERRGVRFDSEYMAKEVAPKYHKELDEMLAEIQLHLGDINLNSPKQLSNAIYNVLKLPHVNKKKPYSTDKKTLAKLKDQHRVIPLLQKYRSLSKMVSAFVDALPERVVDGRVHCSFSSIGAKCVGGDTLIPTSKGIVRIEDMSDHREANSFTDIDGIEVFSVGGKTAAGGFYYSGVKDGFKFTLSDGTRLTTSQIHPLLVNSFIRERGRHARYSLKHSNDVSKVDWVKAEDIQLGDYVALKIGSEIYGDFTTFDYDPEKYTPYYASHKRHVKLPTVLTEDLATLIGAYMADGILNDANGGMAMQIANSDPQVRQAISDLMLRVFNDPGTVWTPKKTVPIISLSCKHAVNWLIDMFDLKRGAWNKTVPDVILKAPKPIQQAFIRGLSLDTGAKRRTSRTLYFDSVSVDMMEKLRAMLLNMGIYCTMPHSGTTHSVVVKGKYLDKYMDEIGFLQECRRDELLSRKPLSCFKGIYDTGDYVLVKVWKKEPCQEELFDLCVPEYESFVGNGVMNHNTRRMSCSKPNMQQVPAKDGPVIRNAFMSDEGRLLVSCDFS